MKLSNQIILEFVRPEDGVDEGLEEIGNEAEAGFPEDEALRQETRIADGNVVFAALDLRRRRWTRRRRRGRRREGEECRRRRVRRRTGKEGAGGLEGDGCGGSGRGEGG